MPGQAAGDSPGFIAPMLASPAAGLPPDAAEFVAEVKWDGLRACIAITSGRVRAWSRSGRDITAAYPELGALAAVVRAENLVHGSDQQSCSPSHPAVMIIDHVPAVHVPPDHAAKGVAAAQSGVRRHGRPQRSCSCATSSP